MFEAFLESEFERIDRKHQRLTQHDREYAKFIVGLIEEDTPTFTRALQTEQPVTQEQLPPHLYTQTEKQLKDLNREAQNRGEHSYECAPWEREDHPLVELGWAQFVARGEPSREYLDQPHTQRPERWAHDLVPTLKGNQILERYHRLLKSYTL